MSHLLLVLLKTLSPQGAPVHTRQYHGAAQQDHKYSLLSIPVTFLFPSWKQKRVKCVAIQCSWYIRTRGITLGCMIGRPHLTSWHWAGFEWIGESGSNDGADYKNKLLCQLWSHLKKEKHFNNKLWMEECNICGDNGKWRSLTVDNKGEVAIIESRVWNRNASLVEAIVDPLAGPRRHVQDSLYRILGAAAD